MDAKKFWLHEFISEKRTFVIPVYQRNYDWKVENCEQLFGDIVHIIKSKKPHFIGTFVYQYDPVVGALQEYIIIDGQQRITSLILLAKAIYDFTDDADLREDIRSKFIRHTTGRGLRNKCRLRPTEYDSATFDKLMSDAAFDEKIFTAQEKSSAMYVNYRFFYDMVAKKIQSLSVTEEELCDAIDQLNVVVILLKEENPQEIFESLNSTGLDLSQADLIRNSLLMPLDYARQEELYKTYWLKIEELLRSSDNVENFFVQYLVAKLKTNDAYSSKVTPKNLYNLFKKFFDNECKDTESCLKDLLRYSKFFHGIIFNDDTDFDKLSALDKKFYELVYLLDAVNAPIVLMYLLDRYDLKHFDEATFIKFVDALISFTFRIKVCRGSGITAQFAGNLIARLDDCKDDSLTEKIFWRAVTFGKGRSAFPKDSKFQEALVSETLYTTIKSDGCKYLLYSLERAARAKELPSYSEATVEHIMPQNLSDKCKDYLRGRKDSAAHEIWLHTLGNLTLTAYNSELGNGDFDAKKEIYAQSNFSCTRALTNYPEWTSVQIQRRAKTLSAEAVKIWTLPAEFNETLPNADEIVTLDSDFAALKNSKPATLIISGTEIKIPYWNHIVREVVRQLYALDPYNFRRAAQMENVRKKFSVAPNDFKIDDDFYMAVGFDTKTCLRLIKLLAENFDMLCGTNFKEEIYFTLKR